MIQLDNRRFIKAYKSFKGMYKVALYYRVLYRNIFGKLCKKNVVAAYDYSRLTDDQNNFSIFLKNLEFKAGVNQRCKRLDITHKRRQKELQQTEISMNKTFWVSGVALHLRSRR